MSPVLHQSSNIAVASQTLPIVVVGTGPVGIRVAQELRQRLPLQPLMLFGNEPWQPYDRIKLSSLLAGDMGLDEISLQRFRRHRDPFLTQHLNCPITEIDRENHLVKDAAGNWHGYSVLILAVGSKPHVPNIPGKELTGVYTFRDLNDVQALLARTTRSHHVMVMGGGLLGLEAARAMMRASQAHTHTSVTVVQQGLTLMNRQLDDGGSSRIRQHIEELGIEVKTGNGVRQIVGDQRVEKIVLRDGTEIKCDTVIIAAGISPNLGLALRAGLAVGRGVRVNDQLQTKDEKIYAVGECVEHSGQTYGLVAPGYEQASVAAEHIAYGRGEYTGSLTVTALKVVGKDVFSMGEVTNLRKRIGQKELTFKSEDRYTKLVVHHGRLIGAISIGSWPEIRRVQELIKQKRSLSVWQQWRFMRSGMLWPEGQGSNVSSWPETAVICNCMNVSKGQLSAAAEAGCDNLASLTEATAAGSVCGSCKPLLQELVGSNQPAEPVSWHKTLVSLSVVSMLVATAILALPSPISDSVQGMWQLEQLWRDGFWKQVTGFSLLGLSVAAATVSLRKRIRAFTWLKFDHWRLLHTVLGSLIITTLIIHSGFSLGNNLNFLLMTSFMALLVVGTLAAIYMGVSHKLSNKLGQVSTRRWQRIWLWGHIIAFWPVPVLLIFHVLSVYYF